MNVIHPFSETSYTTVEVENEADDSMSDLDTLLVSNLEKYRRKKHNSRQTETTTNADQVRKDSCLTALLRGKQDEQPKVTFRLCLVIFLILFSSSFQFGYNVVLFATTKYQLFHYQDHNNSNGLVDSTALPLSHQKNVFFYSNDKKNSNESAIFSYLFFNTNFNAATVTTSFNDKNDANADAKDAINDAKTDTHTTNTTTTAVTTDANNTSVYIDNEHLSKITPKERPIVHSRNVKLWISLISILPLGGVVGSIIGGVLSQTFGRKWILTFSSCIYVIATLIEISSDLYIIRLIGRCVIGVSCGIGSVIGPIYLLELMPVKNRNLTYKIFDMVKFFGLFLATVMGVTLKHNIYSEYLMFLLPSIFSLTFLVFNKFIPESPRYLFTRGYEIEAVNNLRTIRGSPFINDEVNEMREDVNELNVWSLSSYYEMITSPRYQKIIFFVFILMVLEYFCGIWISFYFFRELFVSFSAHPNLLTEFDIELMMIVFATTILLSNGLSLLFMYKSVGLRKLVALTTMTSLSCMAIVIAHYCLHPTQWLLMWKLKSSFLTMGTAFCIMGPNSTWLLFLIGLPMSFREPIVTANIAIGWLVIFIILESFQPLTDVISINVFLVYAIASFLLSIRIIFFSEKSLFQYFHSHSNRNINIPPLDST